MSTAYVIVGLLPLVLFAVVDWRWGPRKAAVSAIVSALAVVAFDLFAFREWDGTLLAEAALVIVLALVSLAKDDALFFRLQPAVTGVALALFLAWFQVFDEPYLAKMGPRLAKVAPEMGAFLTGPTFKTLMARLSGQLIVLFLAHAAIMAYSAKRQSRKAWVLWRMAVYPGVIALTVANMLSGSP